MKFTGIIKQVTNRRHDGGIVFYVSSKDARFKRDEYGRVKCATKNRHMLFASLSAEFNGEYDDDCVWIEDIKPVFISDSATINYLSKRLKDLNIEKYVIKDIVEKYSSDIFSFDREVFSQNLHNDFEELGGNIDNIISELFDPRPFDVIAEYLDRFDLDEPVIRRICDTYGLNAIDEFKKDPYSVAFNMELPLLLADLIASSEGIDGLDRRRIEGYIRQILSRYEQSGDTYAPGDEVLEKVLNEFSRRKLVYSDIEVHAIDVANALINSKQFVLTDDGKLSSKKLYRAEEMCMRRLKELMSQDVAPIAVSEEEIEEMEQKYGVTLGKSQKEAAMGVLKKSPVAILTGGAGTGKTTEIKVVTDIFAEKEGGNIVFCSPTGRAAKRLSESVEPYKASTIHHLLDIRPGINDVEVTYDQSNPLDADFIIVDEVSMVDVELMARLLLAIKNGSRLLFVGDENQLPSVSPGNVLHDMIASGIVPVYRLTDIYRQSADSGIVPNSRAVLKGKMIKAYDDFSIYHYEDNNSARNAMQNFLARLYNTNDPYAVQVIEPTNKDASLTNQFAHNEFVNYNRGIAVGDKVMFKKNGPELVYVNGEFGIVINNANGYVSIYSEEDIVKRIESDALYEECTLAYSVTIHKMQGSEADTVIIYLPEGCAHMMNKKLLYTAITRACKKIIIVSAGNSLSDCIKNEYKERNTRLCDMLK